MRREEVDRAPRGRRLKNEVYVDATCSCVSDACTGLPRECTNRIPLLSCAGGTIWHGDMSWPASLTVTTVHEKGRSLSCRWATQCGRPAASDLLGSSSSAVTQCEQFQHLRIPTSTTASRTPHTASSSRDWHTPHLLHSLGSFTHFHPRPLVYHTVLPCLHSGVASHGRLPLPVRHATQRL